MKLVNKYTETFAEIFQTNETKFALARRIKDGFRLQHNWVLCKDFIVDILQTEEQQQPLNLWNFQWLYNKERMQKNTLYVAIKTPQKNNILISNLLTSRWININNWTRINDNIIVVVIPPIYRKKSFLLSYALLMLKFSTYSGLPEGTDKNYYNTIKTHITFIQNNLKELAALEGTVSGYTGRVTGTHHDNGGILATIKNTAPYSKQYYDLFNKKQMP